MTGKTILAVAREAASIAVDDTTYDETLKLLVKSCSADLKASGVRIPVEEHPLYPQAVRFYVKAFGWTEPDGERWEKCFTALRASMKLDAAEVEYNEND
ncbi:MAG: hypothetical protein IKS06_01940 [Lachnospiraceae bacterium]|nr:hypothetical protein [Lachnospiraceae bacterium]